MNVNAAQSRIRLNPGKWRTPFKRRAYRIVRKILIGFILASLVNFVFSYFFYTPKVYDLVKQNGELLIKYRMLQDKIGKSTELLEEIGRVLCDPVWGGWIGRKHCIPATPVFQGIFRTESEALEKLCSLVNGALPRIWEECSPEAPGAMIYSDIPVDFACREFRPRAVMER